MSNLTLLILLKMAYVVCGLVLCLVGKGLIEKKLEANFEGEGSVGKSSVRIVTTSPGILFLAAGLVAIGAAIFQDFHVTETTKESTHDVNLLEGDQSYSKLVEKTSDISFAGATQTAFSEEDLISTALELAVAGKIDTSAVYVAIAVVNRPASLSSFTENPAFAAVLKDPHLESIIRSRFQLPLTLVNTPNSQISTVAEQILSRLQSLSKWESDSAENRQQALTKLAKVPNEPGQQSKEETLAFLQASLNSSSTVVWRELQTPARRWILNDTEILERLEVEIDLKMKNE